MPNKVRLPRAAADDADDFLLNRLRHDVLQLAALVSAAAKAGEIVTLDPEVDAELCTEPFESVTGGWKATEFDSRKHLNILACDQCFFVP